jgi:hypothetical protein
MDLNFFHPFRIVMGLGIHGAIGLETGQTRRIEGERIFAFTQPAAPVHGALMGKGSDPGAPSRSRTPRSPPLRVSMAESWRRETCRT